MPQDHSIGLGGLLLWGFVGSLFGGLSGFFIGMIAYVVVAKIIIPTLESFL